MMLFLYIVLYVYPNIVVSQLLSNASELRIGANINTPIIHKPYYQGERQLMGYNPLFQPSTVTFDKFNRPYIRTTTEFKPIRPVIQTIRNGDWVELDFLKARPSEFENIGVRAGSFEEERIVFDRDGDIYTLVHTNTPRTTFLLFHSSDYGVSWEAYEFKSFNTVWGHSLTFEYTGIDGNYVGVPLIFVRISGQAAGVIHFTKLKNNTLSAPDIFYYGNGTVLNVGLHSGPPNPGVRIGNKVHIVWASSIEIMPAGGTPQYATTIDLITKEILPPVYLGSTGAAPYPNKPDIHNMPSIVYNGEHLLVILGTHNDQFQYLQSTVNDSTRSWTLPIKIGRYRHPNVYDSSYTYVGLVIDEDKTLHLVSRYSGDQYTFKLVYMRKKFNQPWSDHKELVVPFKSHYGVWYHKVSIDRNNRIFVSYKYYGDQMTQETVDAYHARWPEFPKLVKNKFIYSGDARTLYSYKNIRAHDPVILISDDKGDNFRIATTVDFLNGFDVRTADINKDGYVNVYDLVLILINWGVCNKSECREDIDRDGYVNTSDLSSVVVNWGRKY